MERKKQVEEELPKKYPSNILGLDISTACIGASIIHDDGVNKPEIINITHIVPKIPRKKNGIEALILRKEIFERDFLTKVKEMNIDECVIESPIQYSTSNSTAQTISQLLQFNGLISEAVYRVLGIVPNYVSSYDARRMSFPNLLSIRKFNKKGEQYPINHIKKSISENHLVLFGEYPFDCDKKGIMMNAVSDAYPKIDWVLNSKGELKKENYDACDSLVCALAYVNQKRFGNIDPKIESFEIVDGDNTSIVNYSMSVYGKTYQKTLTIPK